MIHSLPAGAFGIESAKSPPWSRFCRRRQFAHKFESNVRALSPIRTFGTASLYLFVQCSRQTDLS